MRYPAAEKLEIIRLVEQSHLPVRRTLGHLGIPPATAKTRLHRGRRLLRAGLARRLGGGFGDLFPFDGRRCDDLTDRVARLVTQAPRR